MTEHITTKPGKKYASIKKPRVYEALRRQGMSKTRAARISNAQAHKDAGTLAGAPLAGPGGLLGTMGMGGRKWGNRRKDKACTCGIVTKEQLRPGVTRIRGNLCNVHGRYGPCDAAQGGKRKPAKGRKPKAASPSTEARQTTRDQEKIDRRDQVLHDMGIDPGASEALVMLRNGEQPEPGALARMGAVQAGLVEQAQDGSYRMTPSGRALLSAAEAGDVGRAGDVISGARDRTSARTARQETAAQRKRDAEAKRAEAAQKKPAKGGGGKQGGSSSGSGAAESAGVRRQQREQEHQDDRKRRQEEHAADRAQRQQEHEQDRAQRLQERSEDRQAQLDERRSRQRAAPVAQRGAPIAMPARAHGRIQRRNVGTRAKAIAHWDGATWKAETYGGTKRSNLDDSVFAGPDRSFPIKTAQDVRDAVRSLGRTKHDKGAVKRGIIRRARAIGATDALPESWRAATKSHQPEYAAPGLRALRRPLDAGGAASIPQSFIVYKDASGADRWLARSTTAYRDRDREIIQIAALDADSQRMTAAKQFGPLRWWHVGKPDALDAAQPWGPGLDIGWCDFSTQIGTTRVESGTFKDAALAERIAQSADEYELSPGFFHPYGPSGPPDGIYQQLRTFERSLVPTRYGRASNLFTGLTVKEFSMDPNEMERRFKAAIEQLRLSPEQAETLAAGLVQADKSAKTTPDPASGLTGVTFKSDDAPATAISTDAMPGQRFKSADGTEYIKSPSPLDPMGAYYAVKAAAPAMDAEDDPALGGDMGVDEEVEGEAPLDGQYIGDMTPAEFWQQLQQYLAPVLKVQEMHKAIGDMVGELKGMGAAYATKDSAAAQRLDALEATLKALVGDRPAVVDQADVAAALKGAPQAPPNPAAPQIPNDPTRPLAAIAARTMPALYSTDPQNGQWAGWTPPAPLSQS